jgi:hypothetical protein
LLILVVSAITGLLVQGSAGVVLAPRQGDY